MHTHRLPANSCHRQCPARVIHGGNRISSRRAVVVRASQPATQHHAAAAAEEAAVPTTQWSSYVSRRINLELALDEAIEGARQGHADDWQPELAVVFISSSYVQEYGSLISLLRNKVPSLKHITGCTVSPMAGSSSVAHSCFSLLDTLHVVCAQGRPSGVHHFHQGHTVWHPYRVELISKQNAPKFGAEPYGASLPCSV